MKKSKYTIFLVILSIVTLLSSTGCTGKEPMSSVDDTQPVIIEPSEVVSEVVSEVPSEPASEEPQVDPNEELSWKYHEVDEAWLKEQESLGVKRDNKLYTLGNSVPVENYMDTGLGFVTKTRGYIYSKGDVDDERIVMDCNYVLPCVNKDDEIAWYGNPSKTVKLVPEFLYGYTVPLCVYDDFLHILRTKEFNEDDPSINVYVDYYQKKSTELVDANGNDVFSDLRNLSLNDEYTLKWDEDGVPQEEKMVAYWKYYKPTGAAAITLTGSATDDPLVEVYDFSEVPSGIYFVVENYSLIEIKND